MRVFCGCTPTVFCAMLEARREQAKWTESSRADSGHRIDGITWAVPLCRSRSLAVISEGKTLCYFPTGATAPCQLLSVQAITGCRPPPRIDKVRSASYDACY